MRACKKCLKEKCNLWVTLTWREEQTGKTKEESCCAIIGIFNFLAKLENRSIATQKVTEEARNRSTEAKTIAENTQKILASTMQNLTQGLALYLEENEKKINMLTKLSERLQLIPPGDKDDKIEIE